MIELRKAVRRKVEGLDRRPVVVTLHPNGTIGLRAVRTRHEFTLPLARVYRWAVEAEVEQRKEERRKKRAKGLVSRGLLATGRGQ